MKYELVEELWDLYKQRQLTQATNPLLSADARQKRMKELENPDIHNEIERIQDASKKMWAEFDSYDQERKDIQHKIDELTKPTGVIVREVVEHESTWFSILIEDLGLGFQAWMDASYDSAYNDWDFCWNQDIFFTDDPADVAQMLTQENCYMWEEAEGACYEAIYTTQSKS
jgi:hypothetical protein